MKDFEEIRMHVLKKLDDELPSWLTYHNSGHTAYVLDRAEFLADQEEVSEKQKLLIRVAALYHDTGFLISRDQHEKLSCQIALKELKGWGVNQDDLTAICGMIKATRIPQSPETLSEKIVADADLFYFGTEKYKTYSAKLYSEMKYYDPKLSQEAWQQIQIQFLSSHSYHTNYGRNILEPVKRENMKSI